MTTPGKLIVGTRGSQMALVQTNKVIEKLKGLYPELDVTVKVITTEGDTNSAPIPLDTIGKAWFTKEIEQALLAKEIDFAVHSLKDVPPEIPPGLTVLPVLKRDDPRDGLVAKDGQTLATLPKGAIVGTDSLRRKTLLLKRRPDLTVKSVRGNANTRLQKLAAGQYDALVLAAAGLQRIGHTEAVTEYFDPTVFVPAIGQGTLAIEIRAEQSELTDMFRQLQDKPTRAATEAEQAFAKTIGGGCKLPVGCYVHFEGDTVYVHGMVGSMDTKQCEVRTVSGPTAETTELARQLAQELVALPFVSQYGQAASQ